MRISFLVFAKILSALLLSAAVFLCALPQAQAQLATQMYMYSWGNTAQLGRPIGDGLGNNPPRNNQPGRVGNDYWISSATSVGGSFAVNADNELFELTGSAPVQIGSASNWIQVSARGSNRVALNSLGRIYTGASFTTELQGSQGQTWEYVMAGNTQVYAINAQGQLWSSGTGPAAGRGPNPVATLSRVTVPYNNPACTLYWTSVRAGNQFAIAATACNKIFTWGNYAGLGRSTTVPGSTNGIDHVANYQPGRVGMSASCVGFNENWVAVGALTNGLAALNEDGQVYTWAGTNVAALGRPVNAANPFNEPRRVTFPLRQDGTPARVMSIHGGANFILAFTDEFKLYGWGTNSSGQLGLGHNNALPAGHGPQYVITTYGFSNAARGGGTTSIMLMRTTPAVGDLYIAKNLRKLQGAPVPTLEFEFEFERHSFNENPAQANLLPNIPSLTVEIDNTSDSTTAGGVVTLSSKENALTGILFTQVGVYSWMITEVEDSSDTNTNPPSNRRVNYSQARYEVRVDVRSILADFYIYDVSLYRHNRADGTAVIPPEPVDDFDNTVFFTNSYQRWSSGTNTCAGALTVSKEIDGDFVDPVTPFTFEVTLTGTALCVAGTEFSARVYGPNNNFIRTESFEVGETETVILLDEQTLVFPYLPVGLAWEVEELELLEFTAALELTVNGVTNPRATNPNPNLALSTGVHTITAENLRSSAHFINIHFITPPMGLVLGDGVAYVMVATAGFMLVTLLVLKARRRAENANTESESLDLFKA